MPRDPPIDHTAFPGAAAPQTVSAEEMVRRTANYTPYQMAQLRASYAVGERLAAIERACELQMWQGSEIKYREDLYDALAKMTRVQLEMWERSANAARRHCIGLALE